MIWKISVSSIPYKNVNHSINEALDAGSYQELRLKEKIKLKIYSVLWKKLEIESIILYMKFLNQQMTNSLKSTQYTNAAMAPLSIVQVS